MEKYYGNNEKKSWYKVLPLILLVAVVPLIVFLKVMPLTGDAFLFWNGNKNNTDFFSYYKSIWICIFSVFVLIMLALKFFENCNDIKLSKFIVCAAPIIVYTIFVILSTVTSEENTTVALHGFPDRYEGMYVLIAYMIMLVGAIYLSDNEISIKMLIGSLFVSASVVGTIGVFQYSGHDFFKSNFAKHLILPAQYVKSNLNLTFTFGQHTIYGTMYSYDYVGSYMAMLFMLSFVIFIFLKNKLLKIVMAFVTLLMLFNLFGCNSRAGIVGTFLAVAVYLVLSYKYVKKHYKIFAAVVLVGLVLLGCANKAANGAIVKRTKSLLSDISLIFTSSKDTSSDVPLKDVNVYGNTAEINVNNQVVKFKMESGDIQFFDGYDNPIPARYDKSTGKLYLYGDKYKDYQFTYKKVDNNNRVIGFADGQVSLRFVLNNNQLNLISNTGRIIHFEPVETWGFKGKEKLGSSRGYIWSRSIPLLKETIFKGYGPDCFAIHFPQDDFKGKMYAYDGSMWMLVDKPHDLYLQMALNTGVISLLAMLWLFGWYIVRSFKLYFGREINDFYSMVGLAVLTSVIGYLGAAFFNDSVVSVAPVFWVLLGLGISINMKLEKTKNQ